MSSHSGLFFLPVTSSRHGTVGPSAGLTGTTQDAPGAEQTDCHHAVMDLIFSQTLGGRLLLFQAEFSGSTPPPLSVIKNPIPQWPTAAAVPCELSQKRVKKNECQGTEEPCLAPL